MKNATLCCAALLTLAVLAGCGRAKSPELRPVFPVRGTVLVGDKPAAGAVVSFHAQNDSGPRALRANGLVAADGTFSLTTYYTADGAPEGEFIVTIYWPDPLKKPLHEGDESDVAPDLLQGRFASRESSPLRATVGSQAVEFAPLELRAADIDVKRPYHLQAR